MAFCECEFNFDLSNPLWVTLNTSLKINASRKDVWKVMATTGHLEKVHPFCKLHTSKKFQGVGDQDFFVFYNNKEFNRIVIDWKDGESFTLDLFDETNYKQIVIFKVVEDVSGKSLMSIRFETNSFKDVPESKWDENYIKKVISNHKHYFSSVLRGFNHFITTGEVVKRNQFGIHQEYSPKV